MEFHSEVMKEPKNKEKLLEILKTEVCDNCLGRQFGMIGHGMTNDERGKILRESGEELTKSKIKEPSICKLCNNFFKDGINNIVKIVLSKVNDLEFKTFLVGCVIPDELERMQESLWEITGIEDVEPIKSEINREVGKKIEKSTGKKFNLKNPDIIILLDLATNSVRIQIKSLYVYGEYQKLVRGVPQTKWICSKCQGKGCIYCKGEGKMYKTSIQEIIEKSLLKITGSKSSAFHGCISPSTNVLLTESSLPIKELEKDWNNHKVVTYDIDKKTILKSEVSDFIKLNPREVNLKTYELTTSETRRKLIATEDHPIFTLRGMVPLGKIKLGDKVAVYPVEPEPLTNPEEKIIVSEKDIIATINRHVPTSNKLKIIKELKEREILPLTNRNRHLPIITRLLAFVFGDGNLRFVRNRDTALEFYGKYEDLKEIKSDLSELGFKSSFFKRKSRLSLVKNYYGEIKHIKGKDRFVLLCYSKSLCILLVTLGVPVGNKIIKEVEIPKWIKKIDRRVKREFLASLLGTEIDTPRLDKRKYNRKSFNTPRFSINKAENILNNGVEFIEDLANLLRGFGIETLRPRLVPYTTRKDGNKTIKICLDFSNRFENLLSLFGKIGFRYAKKKEIQARYVYEYLLMKKYVVDTRKGAYKNALRLKNEGLTPMQIFRKIDNRFVKYKDLAMWLSPKNRNIKFNNIKIPNDFPDFDEWIIDATKGLKDGLVWETVDSIREAKVPFVYDLTTKNSAHTFFANGFLVANSGREDIDARNLGWRPFVIEAIKPLKRKIDLKKMQKEINRSKVKVRKLKFVDKDSIRKLKTDRTDKTYAVEVEFEKIIDKKLLKNLKNLVKEPILQRTPQRVVHRRANKTRKRYVKQLSYKVIGKKKLLIKVRAEAGLYIKELVTGDDGRTMPNASELLNNKVKRLKLDVIKIHT
ncbi:MAG: hypothetical protein HYW24_01065 [Candidatus Aenigmarchaeota archaeon]|nr:hypothetical protein [Candidatus Aenigmarchaeota archaeon]